jgi:hypothetical protein
MEKIYHEHKKGYLKKKNVLPEIKYAFVEIT